MAQESDKSVKLSVVVPVHNEGVVISSLLDELQRQLSELKSTYEIIVIDDCSTDSTINHLTKRNDIILIKHEYNRGYGAALKSGIRVASGEWILIIDADNTYAPSDIPKLIENIGNADMIIGARTGEDVKIESHKRLGKWFFTRLAEYLLNVKIPDLNSGLRLFRKTDVEKYYRILPNSFSFTSTLTLAYVQDNLQIKYVPINYHSRRGKSKIKPLRDGFNIILAIIRTIMFFNPLKVFLPIGAFLFLSALLIFFYSFMALGKVMDITVIVLLVASLQIVILGLLADLIVRRGTS